MGAEDQFKWQVGLAISREERAAIAGIALSLIEEQEKSAKTIQPMADKPTGLKKLAAVSGWVSALASMLS
ncbi:hypothetical protein A3H89_00695 [Candidatus Amesbacteria bacterium RIFCSPLOWO2_02_FULL_48_11]|uniref:Uncharacterized protein n=3 Tax=Candidatus Amesiibacteriota TaxID=1752730 RepID=A0A1F4Z4Y2_9BACT|nr:MAG: hypothetical protein UY22_C0048G0003 [Candidatus Amesbacteria bacterium GW2011_GWC1_48_10]OGC90456.1 MAG: hypothetical protein A2V48_02435 [Candidatus Amesbacteria bacterium RBG_19FT_COMBO_48_16]OGC95923.1 MAG: hypothetical protein A3C34_01970 [Candidatus Amesbacteria bacterium RIFCSPHIGHO2_02_FULL_48_21]OGC98849.1 MAG: hypothetical protein A2W16_01955 [Candidatus Amesbacteria bacterium RBG_16_48_31]OGD00675.1 MAG: hypothetical protein A2702_01140 [Candidatus Amesbacteria bacterium RIFC